MFHCVEGAFDVTSGGTPSLKNGAPQDELKNGRGRSWAVPNLGSQIPQNLQKVEKGGHPTKVTSLLRSEKQSKEIKNANKQGREDEAWANALKTVTSLNKESRLFHFPFS